MKEKPANRELRASEQLDTLEVICRSLVNVLKKRPDTDGDAGIRLFCEQLDNIDFKSLRSHIEPDTQGALKELKDALAGREEKLLEFKNSLADSVVENRNLLKQHQALQERFNTLNTQLTQMQLHSKEISLKYSTASANLSEREKDLEKANQELQELRARSYHLKSLCADYESQIKKIEQHLSEVLTANKKIKYDSDKALSDLDHIANSNKQLRQSLEALQQRETELVKSIDALQREKNHAQTQLQRMLTGLNKMAVYQQPDASQAESSLLEPKILLPYLPFCFPERLPAAIVFRREIQQKQPTSMHRQSPAPPKSFSLFEEREPTNMALHVRKQGAKIRPMRQKPLETKFHAVYRLQPSLPLQASFYPNKNIDDRLTTAYQRPGKFNFIQPISSREVKLIITRKLRKADIVDNSFELFINYLTREIVQRNFNSDDQFVTVFDEMIMTMKAPELWKNTNIFLETLAFRHRFQLQSQRIQMTGASFNYSFKRSNRLKSVLEMFGNTINSMVQKYDIVATPRNGNSEPENKTK